MMALLLVRRRGRLHSFNLDRRRGPTTVGRRLALATRLAMLAKRLATLAKRLVTLG